MTRARRDIRRSGIRIVLNRRDQILLQALARFGIARTTDLLAVAFTGIRRDTSARRLRRLFDAQFLSVQVSERTAENVYALGPEGRRWADEQGLAMAAVPRGDLRHHLGIVSAWVQLAAAVHRRSEWRLERVLPDWELRSLLAGSGVAAIPDAIVGIANGSRAWTLALELDRGTEFHRALQVKLAAYRELAARPDLLGTANLGLVVLVQSGGERRRAGLEQLGQSWGGWYLVIDRTAWPEGLLTSLQVTPLAASPDGEGRPAVVTGEKERCRGSEGEGPSG